MLLGGLVGGDGELTEGREKGWKVDGDWGRSWTKKETKNKTKEEGGEMTAHRGCLI